MRSEGRFIKCILKMDHKELDVWKKSMDLVELVYKISDSFPTSETYSLTSQIRRAVVSIPSNIAEGAARKGDKEFLYYINIASGSLAEVETQFLIAVRLGYVKENNELIASLKNVKMLLLGLRNYIKRK